MDEKDKITLLSQQLKELTTTIKQLGAANFNAHYDMDKEIKDIKEQQQIVQQKLDKLLENKEQSEQNKFKGNEFAHYKKCSNEQIYKEKYIDGLSWTTLVKRHSGSKSTMQRMCKKYISEQMNDMNLD